MKNQENSENQPNVITVQAIINAPIAVVWETWNKAEHIINWNFASDDWHCPKALVDLEVGGKFSYTMAAKDESFSFDFEGIYDVIETNKRIEYHIEDGRKVSIQFVEMVGGVVQVIEKFDSENSSPIELQKTGWQMILNNYKKYTESIKE